MHRHMGHSSLLCWSVLSHSNNESLDFHHGHQFTSLFSSDWHIVGCLCYDQWFYSWKFILLRYSPKKIKMHMRGSSLVDWLFAKIWFPFFCGRITLLCHLNSGKTRWLVWVKNVNRLHMSLSGRRFKPLCVLSPSLSFVLRRSANCCCC